MTKRLIRFRGGAMAGEFRYVAERSGCVDGPATVTETVFLPFTGNDYGFFTTEPSWPVSAASPGCAEKEAKADTAAATRAADLTGRQTTFTAKEGDPVIRAQMPKPTFTPEDAERAREFRQTHPTDPIDRIAKIASAPVQIVGGLIWGGLESVGQLQDALLGPQPPSAQPPPTLLTGTVFKTMLEIFK